MASMPGGAQVGDPPGSVATALAYSRANIDPLLSESVDARIAQWGDARRTQVPLPSSQGGRLRSIASNLQPPSQGVRQARY